MGVSGFGFQWFGSGSLASRKRFQRDPIYSRVKKRLTWCERRVAVIRARSVVEQPSRSQLTFRELLSLSARKIKHTRLSTSMLRSAARGFSYLLQHQQQVALQLEKTASSGILSNTAALSALPAALQQRFYIAVSELYIP